MARRYRSAFRPRYVLTDPVDGEYWSVDIHRLQATRHRLQRGTSSNSRSAGWCCWSIRRTRQVKDFYIELYDENDDYVARRRRPDRRHAAELPHRVPAQERRARLPFLFEDGKKVTKAPVFFMAELYPAWIFRAALLSPFCKKPSPGGVQVHVRVVRTKRSVFTEP
jgi:hypothetical protein